MRLLSLKNKIMFGVHAMYVVRKLRSPFVAESVAFAVIALTLSAFVSVPSVIANMSHSSNILRYFAIAFSNTRVMIQLMVLLAFSTIILSLRNFANMVARSHLSV